MASAIFVLVLLSTAVRSLAVMDSPDLTLVSMHWNVKLSDNGCFPTAIFFWLGDDNSVYYVPILSLVVWKIRARAHGIPRLVLARTISTALWSPATMDSIYSASVSQH